MKREVHSQTKAKFVETIKKDWKDIGKPIWLTPVGKPGDMLLTTWYGGIQIRENIDMNEFLGITNKEEIKK